MSLDLREIGNKLNRCRTQLKYTLFEVETGTGILSERIADLEDAKAEATGDEILILSDFYKEDYTFFISNQKHSASEKVEILYRKFGNSFTKEDRIAIQEFLYLCECEDFLLKSLEFEFQEFKFTPQGNFHVKHGEDGAQEFREFLALSPNMLIKDIYSDIRKTGTHVFRRRLTNSDISGLFVNHPNAGKCILVNYDEDIYRQNFTVAHEFGHSIFDYNSDINISFFSDSRKPDNYVEVRANSFASNLLIPKEAIKNLKISKWDDKILFNVADQLKVNIMPLLIVLKKIKAISQDEFDNFKHLKIPQIGKEDPELKGSTPKIKEAKTFLLEKGLSTFYVQKCYQAYKSNKITERRMAEMLLTDIFELPVLLNLFSLKLEYGN